MSFVFWLSKSLGMISISRSVFLSSPSFFPVAPLLNQRPCLFERIRWQNRPAHRWRFSKFWCANLGNGGTAATSAHQSRHHGEGQGVLWCGTFAFFGKGEPKENGLFLEIWVIRIGWKWLCKQFCGGDETLCFSFLLHVLSLKDDRGMSLKMGTKFLEIGSWSLEVMFIGVPLAERHSNLRTGFRFFSERIISYTPENKHGT